MEEIPKISIPVSQKLFLAFLLLANVGTFFGAAAQPHGWWSWLVFWMLFVGNVASCILPRLVPTERQHGARVIATAAIEQQAVDVQQILDDAETADRGAQ